MNTGSCGGHLMSLERYPVKLATLKAIVLPTRRNVYLEQLKKVKHFTKLGIKKSSFNLKHNFNAIIVQ